MMYPPRKILCPTDFSDPSLLALETASQMALHAGAEMVLLHVVSPPAAAPHPGAMRGFDTALYLEEMLKYARESMDRLVREKVPTSVPVKSLVRTGGPADEISRAAGEEAADLLVIATHGLTGWKRFIFGSVAERVVRFAPIPVLTIPAPEGEE